MTLAPLLVLTVVATTGPGAIVLTAHPSLAPTAMAFVVLILLLAMVRHPAPHGSGRAG